MGRECYSAPPGDPVNDFPAALVTDGLTVLDESVALIYLDPLFNSHANYNVLFREKPRESSVLQIKAFEDFRHWDLQSSFTLIRLRFHGHAHIPYGRGENGNDKGSGNDKHSEIFK